MILEEGKINKSIPVPMYFQLKELIMGEIKNGNYKEGSMIPTEKEISDFYKISRTTVRQAITELVQEGWLYRMKSKGTFVERKRLNQDFIQNLESFDTQIRKSGAVPSTEVLEFRVVFATAKVAEKLQIPEKSKVIYLYRKRFADARPIVLVETYLPYEKCAFLMERNLYEESLYKNLSDFEETKIYGVKRMVEAVEATSNDAKLMGIKRGKPIQFFETVGYNVFGQPIEYSLARYRGDSSRFEVTTILADEKENGSR